MTPSAAVLLLALAAPAPQAPHACRVEAAATAIDSARAVRACHVARAAFRELFGGPVPHVRIVLWERPGYRMAVDDAGRAVAFWPTSEALARRSGRTGAAADAHVVAQWRKVLPHEIAHVLLAARFDAHQADGDDGYGTPLPDWLEEGVAIWAEPIQDREARLAAARALPDERRELLAILTGTHPAAGNAAALAARDGAPPPDDQALWDFYPQSIAAVAFIYDAGGRDALVELARRLAADPTHPIPLSGLPGLPPAPAVLAATFDAWLSSGGPLGRGTR